MALRPIWRCASVRQNSKKARQPWEKATALYGSCSISGFIPAAEFGDPQRVVLSLAVNDKLRQQGNAREMITPILPLIAHRAVSSRCARAILSSHPTGCRFAGCW